MQQNAAEGWYIVSMPLFVIVLAVHLGGNSFLALSSDDEQLETQFLGFEVFTVLSSKTVMWVSLINVTGHYQDRCLPGCGTVYSGRNPLFWRNVLIPSSGLKSFLGIMNFYSTAWHHIPVAILVVTAVRTSDLTTFCQIAQGHILDSCSLHEEYQLTCIFIWCCTTMLASTKCSGPQRQ